MRPNSLSATALQVADACMARFAAEQIGRGRSPGKSAATLGSTVHGALEMYVKICYLEKTKESGFGLLQDLYKMSYISEFGTSDTDTDEFDDGLDMLKRWYQRTDFSKITVLSCEVKESFPIPTSAGEIPFNYIWDRFDQTGPKELTVVDYKSNRWALSPEDLKKKIQARCYSLAAAIKARQMGLEVDRIWVVFDLLRHDPVGAVFTREDNAATWRFIKDTAERILDTKEEDVTETPNAECTFCVRKVSCGTLLRNAAVGGILGLTFEQAIDRRATLNWQVSAVKRAIDELDEFIETEAKERDVLEYETDVTKLSFKMSKTRYVDPERVAQIVGWDTLLRHGGVKLGIGDFEKKLLKDPHLTPEQVTQLKSLVGTKYGEARVATDARNPIDAD